MNTTFLKRLSTLALFFVASVTVLGCQPARRQNWAQMDPLERDVARGAVSLGMNIPQVKRAWDEKPCDTRTTSNSEGTTEVWTYCAVCPNTRMWLDRLSTGKMEKTDQCEKMRQVIFTNGKVTEVRR